MFTIGTKVIYLQELNVQPGINFRPSFDNSKKIFFYFKDAIYLFLERRGREREREGEKH